MWWYVWCAVQWCSIIECLGAAEAPETRYDGESEQYLFKLQILVSIEYQTSIGFTFWTWYGRIFPVFWFDDFGFLSMAVLSIEDPVGWHGVMTSAKCQFLATKAEPKLWSRVCQNHSARNYRPKNITHMDDILLLQLATKKNPLQPALILPLPAPIRPLTSFCPSNHPLTPPPNTPIYTASSLPPLLSNLSRVTAWTDERCFKVCITYTMIPMHQNINVSGISKSTSRFCI